MCACRLGLKLCGFFSKSLRARVHGYVCVMLLFKHKSGYILDTAPAPVCVCVCVSEKERERVRELQENSD